MRGEMVELMDKFVSWSRVRIFQNERTRSTQLIPKLMFGVFGALGNVSLTDETRCKTGWSSTINAQVCAMKSHQFFIMNTPDPPHWTLNACIGAFCSVWVYFGLFRYCMKLSAKQAELEQLMQKSVPRIRIGFFCSKSIRSTPLDPKLMFWCVS